MAGSADTVGRLLATSVLRDGERQLLRNTGDQRKQAAKPAASPQTDALKDKLPANSKAVATVLLSLLDEQLTSSKDAPQSRMDNAETIDESSPRALSRLQARYSDDAITAREQASYSETRSTSASDLAAMGGRAELLAQVHRLGIAAAPNVIDDDDRKSAKRLGLTGSLAEWPSNARLPLVILVAASLIILVLMGLLS